MTDAQRANDLIVQHAALVSHDTDRARSIINEMMNMLHFGDVDSTTHSNLDRYLNEYYDGTQCGARR